MNFFTFINVFMGTLALLPSGVPAPPLAVIGRLAMFMMAQGTTMMAIGNGILHMPKGNFEDADGNVDLQAAYDALANVTDLTAEQQAWNDDFLHCIEGSRGTTLYVNRTSDTSARITSIARPCMEIAAKNEPKPGNPTICGMACVQYNNVPKEILDPLWVIIQEETKKHGH